MRKPVITILVAILAFCLSKAQSKYSPSDHATFITTSISTRGESCIRLEHDIIDAWAMAQASLLVGPEVAGFQFKVGGCKTWVINKKKPHILRWYIYAPFFNWSFKDKAYNTPFCTEIFYGKSEYQGSINFDIYRDAVIPSVRFRCRITNFRA